MYILGTRLTSAVAAITVILEHVFWLKVRVAYYVHNWVYTTNHKRIAVNYF